jgi:cyclic pyranopterin phosphate synthase
MQKNIFFNQLFANKKAMTEIIDSFGRTFKTLRISLTDVCNLACAYCVDPAAKTNTTEKAALKATLTNNQFLEVVKVLNNTLQLETIRLTGGEPMLYKQLIPLLKNLRTLSVPEIKMTSNGFLLAHKAEELKRAGLTALNISLDAIDPEVSFKISKRRNLHKILAGIEKSIAVGLEVKINCVVMKGVNDNQILPLIAYFRERNVTIRFLELMQMGHLHQNFEEVFFSEEQILNTISEQYNIVSIPREDNATAKYWTTDDHYKIGIISNESDPFCHDCNRLRLDSYGNIFGCLSSNNAINISDFITDDKDVINRLEQALAQKKMKFTGSKMSMLHIGG